MRYKKENIKREMHQENMVKPRWQKGMNITKSINNVAISGRKNPEL